MWPPAVRVTGEVLISPRVDSFRSATLHVALEDVGRVNAPAQLLAEAAVPGVSHIGAQGSGTRVPFEIRSYPDTSEPDPRGHYVVRAWIEGGSRSKSEDYLGSNESYPVLTRGFGSHVLIHIVCLGGSHE